MYTKLCTMTHTLFWYYEIYTSNLRIFLLLRDYGGIQTKDSCKHSLEVVYFIYPCIKIKMSIGYIHLKSLNWPLRFSCMCIQWCSIAISLLPRQQFLQTWRTLPVLPEKRSKSDYVTGRGQCFENNRMKKNKNVANWDVPKTPSRKLRVTTTTFA